MLGSAVLQIGTVIAVAWVAGFGRVGSRLLAIDPIWLLVAFGAEVLAYVGYTLSYRELVRVERGQEMCHTDAAAAVAAGFGPFVARGGFAIDVHAFKQAGPSDPGGPVRLPGRRAPQDALPPPPARLLSR